MTNQQEYAGDLQRLSNPATSGAELQEIAARSPGLRPLVAVHPQAYPALLEWLGGLSDPAVDAALARRASQAGAEPAAAAASTPAAPAVEAVETTVLAESVAPAREPITAVPAANLIPRAPTEPVAPAAVPESSPTSGRGTRRWIPIAAVAATVALVGGAAAIVLPRVLGSDGSSTGADSGDSGSDVENAAAQEPAGPTFRDGASFTDWEIWAEELAGGEAFFPWNGSYSGPEIAPTNLGPFNVGGAYIVPVVRAQGTPGPTHELFGVDAVTGETLWSIPRDLDCQPFGVTIACVESTQVSQDYLLIEAATGQILTERMLTTHPGANLDPDGVPTTWPQIFVKDGHPIVLTENPGAGETTVSVLDDNADDVMTATSSVTGPDGLNAGFGGGVLTIAGYDELLGEESWEVFAPDGTSSVTGTGPVPGLDSEGRAYLGFDSVVLSNDNRLEITEVGAPAFPYEVTTPEGKLLIIGDGMGVMRIADPATGQLGEPLAAFGFPDPTSFVHDADGGTWVSYDHEGSAHTHRVDGEVIATAATPRVPRFGDGIFYESGDAYWGEVIPLRAIDQLTGEELWTLDIEDYGLGSVSPTSIALLQFNGQGRTVSFKGLLPGEPAPAEVVAAPAGIPDCPAETVLLAWGELSDGWFLVCGYSANEPTYFAMATGSSSETSTTSVSYNAGAGRYDASFTDGSSAWAEHTPSVLGVRDPSGVTSAQQSVTRIYFVELGAGGEAQGVGAYDVAPPAHTAEDQVRYLSEILAKSQAARAALSPAVVTVRDCLSPTGDYSAEIAVMADVRDNRAELSLAVQSAPVDLVPQGALLVDELLSALSGSYNADVAYLAWAEDVNAMGCGAGDESPATEYSRQAGVAKEAFSARWNSVIAPVFGVPTVSRENL